MLKWQQNLQLSVFAMTAPLAHEHFLYRDSVVLLHCRKGLCAYNTNWLVSIVEVVFSSICIIVTGKTFCWEYGVKIHSRKVSELPFLKPYNQSLYDVFSILEALRPFTGEIYAVCMCSAELVFYPAHFLTMAAAVWKIVWETASTFLAQ